MSRVTARGLLAAILVLSILALPAATAGARAPSKALKCKKGYKLQKRGAKKRCVKVRRPPRSNTPSTPVTVQLLDGSQATVDVPSLPLPGGYVIPGTPVTRTVPISGTLKGTIPGGYMLGKDNNIVLNDGTITPGPVDVLADGACSGSTILKIDPASTVALDKTAPSAGVVKMTGDVTANVRALLKLSFDSRQGTGCADPLVTMGSSESLLPVALAGKIEKATGLTALTLDAPATPLTIAVCLTPGAADQPCATPPVGYPVKIAVHVIVKISVG